MRTVKTDTIEVWKAKIIEQEHINKLLADIKAEIKNQSFNHYFEHGEYIGEDCTEERIIFYDKVIEIIDKHISGKENNG